MKLKEKFAKDIIKERLKNIPEELHPKDNICIAGGFALSVYMDTLCIDSKEDVSKKYVVNHLDPFLRSEGSTYYSDIDYFRIGDGDKTTLDSIFSEECSESINLKNGKLVFIRNSEHANTFHYESRYFSSLIQGVTYKYDSIEDMFSSFDLSISCVAIVGDKLVFSEEFENSMKNKALSIVNKKFFSEENKILHLMYQANRVAKYLERFGRSKDDVRTIMRMSDELSKVIYDLILKTEEFDLEYWKKDNNAFYDHYGRKRGETQSDLSRVYMLFSNNISTFLRGMSSNSSAAPFLIGSKNLTIQDQSKRFILKAK